MFKTEKPIVLTLTALTIWYTLSFIGIPGVIETWFVEEMIWILVAFSIWAPLVVGLWSYIKGHNYTDFMVAGVTALWAFMAYQGHWQWFFTKPSAEKIASYYAFFDTWYLLPKQSDRIVPDGYHAILHALILLTLILVVARLVARIRK